MAEHEGGNLQNEVKREEHMHAIRASRVAIVTSNGTVVDDFSGGGSAAYSDSGGTDRKGLVDADRHVQTDVLSSALPTGASTLAEQQTQTTSLSVLDDWDESDRAKVNLIAGQAGVAAGAGDTSALTIRTIRANLNSLKVNQQTKITSSTSETTILTAVASTYLDLYGLVIANTSATPTKVTIKDDTGGSTRFVLYIPAGDTRGFMLPVDAAHNQSAVNKNWTATCGTSVADIEITALAIKRT